MNARKVKLPFFEIGPKSYLYGDDILDLAKAADAASEKYGVDIIFTTPVVDIRRVREATKNIHVFAPHMDPIPVGRGLADILPESLVAAGADGVMLNHCEKPLDFEYAHSLNNITDTLECQPEISVVSCGYTINSPTMLEIRADLALNAAVLEKQGIELITDLKLNEQKLKPKHNNCALTVYFVSGQECVWDIARVYNASVDEIIKINDIKGEYASDGSMLLVPTI